MCDVHQPNQKWSNRSVLAPSASVQALLPETDVHVYSRTHVDRGSAMGNGTVWTGQRKTDILHDFIWLLPSMVRKWSLERQNKQGTGNPEWQRQQQHVASTLCSPIPLPYHMPLETRDQRTKAPAGSSQSLTLEPTFPETTP